MRCVRIRRWGFRLWGGGGGHVGSFNDGNGKDCRQGGPQPPSWASTAPLLVYIALFVARCSQSSPCSKSSSTTAQHTIYTSPSHFVHASPRRRCGSGQIHVEPRPQIPGNVHMGRPSPWSSTNFKMSTNIRMTTDRSCRCEYTERKRAPKVLIGTAEFLYIMDYVFYLFLIFALLDPRALKIAMKRSIPSPKGGSNVFHPV